MPLVDAPGRLMLPSGAEGSGPGSVQAIASHFGVECSEDEARAIHEAALPQLAETETARALEFSRDEEVAVAGAVDGLNGILVDGRFERIAATRHFFTYAGSGKPPLDQVDATGRNQLLLFGPYISLPPGDWTARCVYGFSEGLVGTPMSIDVVHFLGGFHELARTSFTVTSSGRLDVNVRFLHTEPSALLEVRLFVDRAVFDGTVSFGFVEFRRNKADVNRSAASLMDFDPSALS
jgi:hypothetical protein